MAATSQDICVCKAVYPTRHFTWKGVSMIRWLLLIFLLASCSPARAENELVQLQIQAEQGDAKAQYHLGSLYEAGRGVERDTTVAAKWFLKAANQGNADAQSEIGMFYVRGIGVKKDYSEAAKWLLKGVAKRRHDFGAQSDLGDLYAEGLGVTQNWEEAYFWYSVAARGEPKAISRRNRALNKLTPAQISSVKARLREWLSKSPGREKSGSNSGTE